MTNTVEPDTEEGTIQLAGGSGPHEGRVEVVFASTWGTVCGHDWDLRDALVVCRQLGYYTALNATSGTFGEGSGPIWWDAVNCRGNETSFPVQYHSQFRSVLLLFLLFPFRSCWSDLRW